MKKKETKFNWKLPVYGAIGFGIGHLIAFYIWDTIKIAWIPSGYTIGFALGSAALGLALYDKRRVLYLFFAGAIGFAIGKAIGFQIWVIFSHLIQDIHPFTALNALSGGIGSALGGAALGLALYDKKKPIYLFFAGAIGFSIWFVIWGSFGNFVESVIWETLGGVIMGIALGSTLAYLIKGGENKLTKKQLIGILIIFLISYSSCYFYFKPAWVYATPLHEDDYEYVFEEYVCIEITQEHTDRVPKLAYLFTETGESSKIGHDGIIKLNHGTGKALSDMLGKRYGEHSSYQYCVKYNDKYYLIEIDFAYKIPVLI